MERSQEQPTATGQRRYAIVPPPGHPHTSDRTSCFRPTTLPPGIEWDDIPPPPNENYFQAPEIIEKKRKKTEAVIAAAPVGAPEVEINEEVKRFVPSALQRRRPMEQRKPTSKIPPEKQMMSEQMEEREYTSFVEDMKNMGAYD